MKSEIGQQLLDLIFPPRCAGCKQSGTVLCSNCLTAVQLLQPPFCQRCSAPLYSGKCEHCQQKALRISGLRVASIYQEPLRSYIHDLKYNGNTRLARPLGKLLAQVWRAYGVQADMLIAVPLDKEREHQRGYNHAALLAESCATELQLPVQQDLLIRHRATTAQVGLTQQQRKQNVEGAFSCTPLATRAMLYGRTVLLIDDVYTTGATTEACAEPLFMAGARAVWALVLARPAESRGDHRESVL